MREQPTLHSKRLILRPFDLADAPDVAALVGAREIASTTLAIPHPYEENMAVEWIVKHRPRYESGEGIAFAIVEMSSEILVGAIGLRISSEHQKAEMGYWIGVPYWGRGYATEAAFKILEYGFQDLGLNRIYAAHLVRNPASGRVLKKIGMNYEGRRRQDILKWGAFEDLDTYAILKKEFQNN